MLFSHFFGLILIDYDLPWPKMPKLGRADLTGLPKSDLNFSLFTFNFTSKKLTILGEKVGIGVLGWGQQTRGT